MVSLCHELHPVVNIQITSPHIAQYRSDLPHGKMFSQLSTRAKEKVSTTRTQTRKFYFLKFPSNGLIFYWQIQNHVQSDRETFLSHY